MYCFYGILQNPDAVKISQRLIREIELSVIIRNFNPHKLTPSLIQHYLERFK